MSRGAKQGENRFKNSQKKRLESRLNRIREAVIPTVQSYVGKISIPSKAAYCKLCSEIFNSDLPVNEKPIGYRTVEQNIDYWSLVGPIYHRNWAPEGSLAGSKDRVLGKLAVRENQLLKTKVDELEKRSAALQAALRNHGAEQPQKLISTSTNEQSENREFELTCRALKIVIDASEGSFEIDEKAKKIIRSWDDLEPSAGLVPKELIEPFINWLAERRKKTGGRS